MEAEGPRSRKRLIAVPAVIMTEKKAREAVAEGCTAMGEMGDPFSRQEALTMLFLKET